ncbi:MAG: phosphoglucosamine mutase [Cyanobacteria bacterium QH_8_48_120]|jgi:phosphoglucosamine mutase|nr:MAG: phosphoglucosamine mutase [Cyanobacteria bacterium QH_8_48_120]
MVASPFDSVHSRSAAAGGVSPFDYSLNLPQTRLFGTDGIRGRAGELLSAPLALQVGFWGGQLLQDLAPAPSFVILGRDSRNSSDMLATALSAGLTSAGLDVWDLGLCPSPGVASMSARTEAVGGVMISASHNPPEDNGIKFFAGDGTKLSKARSEQIEAGLRGVAGHAATAEVWGKYYNRESLVGEYIGALARSLPAGVDLRGMRIVLDLAWGAAVELAPSLFRGMGAEVTCLHHQPDGDRINVGCGSTHLGVLQKAVKQFSADMGFAFDGDADRVMAVDAQGRAIDGDYILYFWGQTLKAAGQLPEDLLVATVMANLGFERAWQGLGGQLVRTPVGDSHVQAQMWHTGAMLGGEQSGHVICHHYSHTGDGLQTALHLASLVRQSGSSLAELVEQSFPTYPQILRNVRVEDRDRRLHWQDCNSLQEAITAAEADMGDRGRVLVRASGTEPVIRIMVEAAYAQVAQHWSEQLVKTTERHLTE